MIGPFAEVLAHYPHSIRDRVWVRVESSGGLSGAEIWGDSARHFAAKGYPPGSDALEAAHRHVWMHRAAQSGLEFVPRLVRTSALGTLAFVEGRYWEIASWMPGDPDFAAKPSVTKMLVACEAVITLHGVWRTLGNRVEVPRAVRNRLDLFEEWRCHPASSGEYIRPALETRARVAIALHLPRARAELQARAGLKLPCSPCIRDLRREHVLFTGDKLTGLIDYGAAAIDTPATDAARMLGELAPHDPELYALGLERLAAGLGTEACPPGLVRMLDRSGMVGAAMHWLYRQHRPGFANLHLPEVEMRLAQIVGRLEAD